MKLAKNKQNPQNQPEFPWQVKGMLWVAVGEQALGGPTQMVLLAKIAEWGSITQAAKAAKMSYKGAWEALDRMNNLAGEPLVERFTGGKGGGATRLTPRGQKLLDNYRLFEREQARFLAELGKQIQDVDQELLCLGRINMKTSARNQLLGRISQIRRGAVNDEIVLCLPGGEEVVAVITHESTQALGLQVGAEAYALIKAASVMLMTGAGKLSARNQLTGTVARIQAGPVNADVVLQLAGGSMIAAVITHDSLAQLGLREGDAATAVFKASSVILGV